MFTCAIHPARSTLRAFVRAAPTSGSSRTMPIEAWETQDEYVLRAELPGLTRADIEVEIEKQEVRIGAKRERSLPADAALLINELRNGRWERRFALPQPIDTERAQANYQEGILSLRLPKLTAEPSRRIAVN